MNFNRIQMLKTGKLISLCIIFLTMASVVHAATHIIRFGGDLGETYSPKTLNVAIGDIVRWEGDFSSHPLSSTSVPPGALSFHAESGAALEYEVIAEGVYNYRCDSHYDSGMTGSFVATTTGIEERQNTKTPGAYQLNRNYPNPFNPSTIIGYQLPAEEHVELRIYNTRGRLVLTLINDKRPAGNNSVVWDGSDESGRLVASGLYIYRIKAGGFISTKTMLLVR